MHYALVHRPGARESGLTVVSTESAEVFATLKLVLTMRLGCRRFTKSSPESVAARIGGVRYRRNLSAKSERSSLSQSLGEPRTKLPETAPLRGQHISLDSRTLECWAVWWHGKYDLFKSQHHYVLAVARGFQE